MKSLNVIGESPFFALLVISSLNQNGYKVEVIMITENIPIKATNAKEWSAGCLAKISEPMERIVVKTARMMDVL
jgi:hypothetical protein